VKAPGGRVSPDQVAFKEIANLAGTHYYNVRSIDDVETLGL
jgi:hypothetical protein